MKMPLAALLLGVSFSTFALAAEPPASASDTRRGDKLVADYFAAETGKLRDACLADVKTLDDWTGRRELLRGQLFEMLGLDPLPERTPLQVTYTGEVDHPEFTVKKLHYQSRPGLYVTGNLYVPKGLKEKAPTILYVCGHARVVEDGKSLGNKTAYQHHGGWYARNGYVCLTIDTLQLGEIEGIHHGTYKENMWWWNSRGYTSAGVEAWNCIRALDLLESLPEVDAKRIGVTGRSGGGAYSWWIAALDERIAAAVPVAGITDLENHVIDGTVEGHCDCMFMVNTFRWDYPLVAALVAPRPLLISNSDKDNIFPLEGVARTHALVRKIYRLYKADERLGLQITEGPHIDTQVLHIHSFQWFNRFLKGGAPMDQIEKTATLLFPKSQLKVFDELPGDAKNGVIQDTFTKLAEPQPPKDKEAWEGARDGLRAAMMEKTFRGWPGAAPDLGVKPAIEATKDGVRLRAWDFTSQEHVPLRLYVAQREGLDKPTLVVLNALNDKGWSETLAMLKGGFADKLGEEIAAPGGGGEPNAESWAQTQKMFQSFPWAMAYVAPRGVGPTAWSETPKKQIQIRRRFALLGQTLAGMQVWDVRRGAQVVRTIDGLKEAQLWMQGEDDMAAVTLLASLFEPKVHRLDLHRLPQDDKAAPDFLNLSRLTTYPQLVALAAENSQVRLYQEVAGGWEFPQTTLEALGWDKKQLQVRVPQPKPVEGEKK